MPVSLQPAFTMSIGAPGTSEAYQFNCEGMVEVLPDASYDGMQRVTVNKLGNKWLKPFGKVPAATVVNDTTFNVANYATMDAPHQVFTDKEIIERQNRFNNLKRVEIVNGATRITPLFRSHNNLQEVILPASCTEIMSHSFDGCSNFEKINLNNIDTIGVYAFANSKLKQANLSSVTKFGSYAFNNCTSLETVIMPTANTLLASNLFQNCTKLNNVVLPTGITEIPTYCFYRCTSLTNLTIPNTVTKISGGYNFNGTGFTGLNTYEEGSLNLPSSVTTLGSDTFSSSKIVNAVVPSSITNINSYLFEYCKSLKTVDFAASTSYIPSYAFNGCIELESVTISSPTVTSINNYAFQNCNKLTNVTFPDTITTIYGDAFNITSGTKPELTLTFLSTTPPYLNGTFTNCNLIKIKVPADSVNAYKAANNWSNFAGIIEAI